MLSLLLHFFPYSFLLFVFLNIKIASEHTAQLTLARAESVVSVPSLGPLCCLDRGPLESNPDAFI